MLRRPSSVHNVQTSSPLKALGQSMSNFMWSLLGKGEQTFIAMLEYCEPEIILASEVWLNPTIAEREVLPESYRFVARKDRPNSSHGGVAIIAKHDLEASEIDVQATPELVAASFTCKDIKKPVIVCSFYRPTDNKLEYSQELCNTVKDIHSRFGDHVLWLGGDANLPDIDWKSDTINGNRYSTTINQLYTDTINDIGCEQMVDFPTRIDNTLDIFCTNRPSLVDRCIPLPGLSDHDTVLVDCKVLPARK